MKCLLYFHGGSRNRGCEAIVRTTKDIIKETIQDASVYLVSKEPETDKVIKGLDAIYDGSDCFINKYSYDWFISSFKVKLLNDESYAHQKIHGNIIKHIKDVDICLSIGGDNYCYGEQPGIYEVDKVIKSEGKKLILWGCSIGEEDLSVEKLNDLRLFDLILARESLTYELLRSHGLTNVEKCADPAFTLDKKELPLPEGWKTGNTIGLNLSPLVLRRNGDAMASIHKLVSYMLRTTNSTIVLTPHVIAEGNNDYEVLKQIYSTYEDTGRVLLLPNDLNAMEYKGYISRMRFFIGARTHATIAAYSSRVPTMVLGYSVKSKGISKDLFGNQDFVMDIKDLSNSDKLKRTFDKMVEQEGQLARTLQERIPEVQKMSFQAAEHLKNILALV